MVLMEPLPRVVDMLQYFETIWEKQLYGPQLSRQNQKPHGKTENLTAKTKTSRQNQKPHGKSNYPRQNQSYFVVALKYLILPWGFWFCRDVFVFAVRFLVLPWQLWATIQLYSKEWSHAIARTARGDPSDNNNTRLFSLLSVNKFKSFVLNSL